MLLTPLCRPRLLLQESTTADVGTNATASPATSTLGAVPNVTTAGVGNVTGNLTGNATHNATGGDTRSRRSGGDGWGDQSYQPVYCGSINCRRRKLLQNSSSGAPSAGGTGVVGTVESLASNLTSNATGPVGNVTGLLTGNATGNTTGNATGNATDVRARHHGGDGWGGETYQGAYCGSINCLRRKLLGLMP